MSFDRVLSKLAEKWREVPGGSDRGERQFSNDLLDLSDLELLADWELHNIAAEDLRGWYWRLYAGVFRGRKVLEIGSGRGFDAMHFAAAGAQWTCCDIAPTNLEVIERVAVAKGVAIATLPIVSLASFDTLPRDFDFVWCNGSLLNIPFEEAREECAAILSHLIPGGRWIELAYPRERWVREGSPAFDQWGALTDGERTPWVEWYDMEKLKERLFPARLLTVLDHRFHGDNYIWMDVLVVGRHEGEAATFSQLPGPGRLEVQAGLWRPGWSTPLPPVRQTSAVAVDIQCSVFTGTIGFALERDGKHISREAFVEARTGSQLVHLTTQAFGEDVYLAARNASALGAGSYDVGAIEVRAAL